MQTRLRQFFLGAAVASCFALTLAAFAQEPAPAAPVDKTPSVAPAAVEQPAPVAPTAPVAPVAAPAPAAATAVVEQPTPAAPVATLPPAAAPAEKKEPELRRLDSAPEAPAKPAKPGRANRRAPHLGIQRGGNGGNAVVSVGHDSFLAKDQKADAVVSVFGSSTSEGEVADAVVSILGDTRVTGSAGGAAVAVLGNNYVNGKVGDVVVAVLGDVELGPDAEVGGEVVSIGGTVKRDPKAVVHGQVQNVALAGGHANLSGLRTWFRECLLLGRPLAFHPGLGWAWTLALGAFVLYFLLALLFSGSVDKGVTTLETRPGFSILTAILSILLIPVLIVLLVVTVVGIVAIPFVVLGLFIAGLFGKTVMLAWLGRRFTKFFGDGIMSHTAVAVLIGGAITLMLYCVPFVGMIVQKSFDLIGLGAVIYALILASKREKPAAPAASVPSGPAAPPMASMASTEPAAPVVALPVVPPAMPMTSAGFGAMGAVVGDVSAASAMPAAAVAPLAPPLAAPAAAVPSVVSATTYPRAGFFIRLAALLLDFILIGILTSFFFHGGKFILVAVAAYGAVMWKMKGTTIGGIVCGLKVVRLDDREIDWSTAIVRALGCFLSLFVVGLGFLWVAIDDEKQSWHDKIAGTTVVRVPKGVPLV